MKKSLFILLLFLLSNLIHSQNKLEISKLCNDFYVFTTYQSYKGILYPANGLYVVSDKGVILIDTPWDSTQFQPLLDSIEKRHQQKVVLCIATHYHDDRTGGLKYYSDKGIRTYTSTLTAKLCREKKEKSPEFTFTNDTVFTIGNKSLETLYRGQGHSPDNIAIWFSKEKVLYGGCMIKSTEAKDLGNLADANVPEWSKTLKLIKRHTGKPKYIIPGHQSWKSLKSPEHTLGMIKNFKP